ncbi:MAG: hypothetical protein EXX96DRAFT_645171 [Benjaminiella poitrasii]|nr:MAG: hypothetical protein EXX96DRAFT_652994 [Benjaminiella poitrasii]KAI9476608.1 MAG: hypothetical protein EXX96DRAFT_652211 [Benjaminiella poitrasii]KAI9485161.1 MAG: hypothetical protein EXX96DRAFT_645169 [Benjaminiella poitrasii]KAI9485163.1 MAG: hypothetical protein EXX96DRAFT_645171 [Benjaminiella poitrasii]
MLKREPQREPTGGLPGDYRGTTESLGGSSITMRFDHFLGNTVTDRRCRRNSLLRRLTRLNHSTNTP